MLVRDQRVPGPAVCTGGDRHDLQILNLLKPVRNFLHRRYRGLENMRTRTNRRGLWRRQSDQFRTCLQSSERLQTPRQLRTTPRIEETELIAKPTPDRVTTEPLAKLPYEQIFLAVFWRAIDGTGATPGGIM